MKSYYTAPLKNGAHFFGTKVFQKGTMFWMSLGFSLTWDSVSRNCRRQGFMVAWVCIAAPSLKKK